MADRATDAHPERSSRGLAVAQGIVSSALLVAYPLIVYFGFTYLGTRRAALLMLAALAPVALARLRRLREARLGALASIPIVSCALLAMGAALEGSAFVLAVPSAVNLVLFATFAPTLLHGPPMIERFARLQHEDLRDEEIRWCRGWTIAWSVFFSLNALSAALLAAFAPLVWWTFHTSVLGYVLMGLMLGGEWVARKLRFKRFGGGFIERKLSRLVEQRATP